MKALIAALLLALIGGDAYALTITEASGRAQAKSGPQDSLFSRQTTEWRWAKDSWFSQDKFWDHGSFAFVLAQVTEDVFRPMRDRERLLAWAANMAPWAIKEILDAYAEEGASYKDFIWSAAGAALALIIH